MLGQRSRQELPYVGDRRPLIVFWYDVSNKAPTCSTRIIASHHHCIPHTRAAPQDRLDLTGLDPEPADLHLSIGATEELDNPVHPIPAEIACAIEASSRNPPNRSGINRSAVNSVRFQ